MPFFGHTPGLLDLGTNNPISMVLEYTDADESRHGPWMGEVRILKISKRSSKYCFLWWSIPCTYNHYRNKFFHYQWPRLNESRSKQKKKFMAVEQNELGCEFLGKGVWNIEDGCYADNALYQTFLNTQKSLKLTDHYLPPRPDKN